MRTPGNDSPGTAANSAGTNQPTSSPRPWSAPIISADTVAAQLRRRREAAKRLAPLPNGVVDPWAERR